MIMIKVRLHTGHVYEALARQGSAVLIRDGKRGKAYFVTKKNIAEWHNGISKMLPEIDDTVFADTTEMDKISVDEISKYLKKHGVENRIAVRTQNCCIHAEMLSLGDLFRLGKKSAGSIRDMGAVCIDELTRVFKEQYSLEWK